MRGKKNYPYIAIVLVLLFSAVLLGNYQLNKLKEHVLGLQSELSSKQEQIDNLSSKIEETSLNKQKQIDNLSSKIEETSKEAEKTARQYNLQIGELNQQLSDLAVESESFGKVIQEVIGSVVSVLTDAGQGSGAIISSQGYVVTNYHVIEQANKASIMTYDGKLYGVRLIGYNKENDLAVLEIKSNESFGYMEFADSSTLKVGQKVVALGNPAGLSFTATEGIISSPSRMDNGQYYIQTDVSVNPGNSGGPLINSQGKIVGIINFKLTGYEGLGFAIPSNRAKEVVANIVGYS